LCLYHEFYGKFLFHIANAKSFQIRYITYLYFSYLSRYSLIQIQVNIFLSGTDVSLVNMSYSPEYLDI
jgi:hypothetical protein